MKKLLSVLLVLVMVFSFAACGAQDDGVNLTILIEEDDSMINTYSLLAVDPEAPFADANQNPVSDVELNTAGADALINWMLSQEAADLIKDYGVAEYDDYLFYNLDGAPVSDVAIPVATEETKVIRMSTTTSVNDTGLLGYMIPIFEEGYGYDVEILYTLILTPLFVVLGVMGDLSASLIKRKCEIKDFGKLIPGHGGILDRFDSILMISPIYLILISLGVL